MLYYDKTTGHVDDFLGMGRKAKAKRQAKREVKAEAKEQGLKGKDKRQYVRLNKNQAQLDAMDALKRQKIDTKLYAKEGRTEIRTDAKERKLAAKAEYGTPAERMVNSAVTTLSGGENQQTNDVVFDEQTKNEQLNNMGASEEKSNTPIIIAIVVVILIVAGAFFYFKNKKN